MIFRKSILWIMKLTCLKNCKHKSRFAIFFVSQLINAKLSSLHTRSHPIISAFALLFFYYARANSDSKARSINIRERSVARRRGEQMNNILIDRPEKSFEAPWELFSISRVHCQFSDFFFPTSITQLKTTSNLRRWLFSRKVRSVYRATTGHRVYSIITNFNSRFYFPARKYIWIYSLAIYANECYLWWMKGK